MSRVGPTGSASGGGGGGGTSSDFGAPFPSSGTAAGFTDGVNMQPGKVDGSGNLLVAGSLTVTPPASSTVTAPAITTVGTGSTSLLAANTRKRLTLQNAGTTIIYILFGSGVASATNYHIALPAGGTTKDGSSPIYQDTLWQGAIQASSSSTGGSVAVGEFT